MTCVKQRKPRDIIIDDLIFSVNERSVELYKGNSPLINLALKNKTTFKLMRWMIQASMYLSYQEFKREQKEQARLVKNKEYQTKRHNNKKMLRGTK